MTEAEWLAATDSGPMAVFLRRATSNRKMRLFACACCRSLWPVFTDPRRRSIEVAEQSADGLIDCPELSAAHAQADSIESLEALAQIASYSVARIAAQNAALESWAVHAALAAGGSRVQLWIGDPADKQPCLGTCSTPECAEYRRRAADLLRCVFGSPFRLAPAVDPPGLLGTAEFPKACRVHLRRTHPARRHIGSRPPQPARRRLGGRRLHQLRAARPSKGPGPHVRGCWALDLVLGKE
jgi:hypothetical protein